MVKSKSKPASQIRSKKNSNTRRSMSKTGRSSRIKKKTPRARAASNLIPASHWRIARSVFRDRLHKTQVKDKLTASQTKTIRDALRAKGASGALTAAQERRARAALAKMYQLWKLRKGSQSWVSKKPSRGTARHLLKQKCGAKCFLFPEEEKYPICAECGSEGRCSCEYDCSGLLAANKRARQMQTRQPNKAAHNKTIGDTAVMLARKAKCGWATRSKQLR